MSSKTDWLPSNHEKLFEQATLTKNYLDKSFGNFGLDGKSAQWINEVFKPAYQNYVANYNTWLNPEIRTPTITAYFQAADRDLRTAYRELYMAYLRNNPNVSDGDLVAMGLPRRSTAKPTPSPVPSTYPDLTIEPDGIRTVKVSFRDHDSNKIAKPHGVMGAVLRWAILPAAPVEVEELTNTVLDTRSPYLFVFDEGVRGQMLYVCAAWENTRGEKGRWSEIVNTIVP